MSKRELGVIIARFQTPALTQGHLYMLEQAATRVNRTLVLLGVGPVPFTKKNPLEFTLRRGMLIDWWANKYLWHKELEVLPLYDCPTDEEWASNVDKSIELININGSATVFSGPDGAAPTYARAGGKWPIEVFDCMQGGHATAVRYGIEPKRSEDFRAGVIYAVERRFNNPLPVVDVVIRDGDQVLLGHKKIDGDKWRLIGGFADADDISLEAAVRREVREETGLEISEPMYVGSAHVDDWRFRAGPETILTSVFSCQRIFGAPVPNDDIDDLRWFRRDEITVVIHPVHAELYALASRVQ